MSDRYIIVSQSELELINLTGEIDLYQFKIYSKSGIRKSMLKNWWTRHILEKGGAIVEIPSTVKVLDVLDSDFNPKEGWIPDNNVKEEEQEEDEFKDIT